jgi:hypothetical protein
MAHTLTHRNVHVSHDDNDYADNDTTQEHAVVDHELQRSRFGGFHFGASFFGWLVATGLSTMLLTLLAAAGSAVALSSVDAVTTGTAATVGVISGVLFILALAVAYYAGGYVAGRMARFDGVRQGVGVWAIGLVLTIVLGVLGATLGSKYNLLAQLSLPSLPVNGSSFTRGGIITGALTVLGTLAAAVAGAKQGERYHNRIDETGQVGTVAQ